MGKKKRNERYMCMGVTGGGVRPHTGGAVGPGQLHSEEAWRCKGEGRGRGRWQFWWSGATGEGQEEENKKNKKNKKRRRGKEERRMKSGGRWIRVWG